MALVVGEQWRQMFYASLPYAGPILFVALLWSSLMTAMRVVRQKSTGKLSFVPFASLFLDTFVWTLYGVLERDSSIYIANGLGIAVSMVCIGAFHAYSTARPWHTYWVLLFSSVGVLVLIQLHLQVVVGWIACALSVLLSGAPLAVLDTVIKEKSTSSLPFSTSLIMWLNNVSWFCYGYLVVDDELIYGPNALGLVLSTAQLALFVVYGFGSERHESSRPISV